jgi:hypothetical protein
MSARVSICAQRADRIDVRGAPGGKERSNQTRRDDDAEADGVGERIVEIHGSGELHDAVDCR